jgi:hypothetical protein
MRRLSLLLVLAGCSQPTDPFAAEKAIVLEGLKDPGSAQFRNLKRYTRMVCGEVNAKNSYGGYVGFEPFLVSADKAELVSATGDPIVDTVSRSHITVECGGAEIDDLNKRMKSGK